MTEQDIEHAECVDAPLVPASLIPRFAWPVQNRLCLVLVVELRSDSAAALWNEQPRLKIEAIARVAICIGFAAIWDLLEICRKAPACRWETNRNSRSCLRRSAEGTCGARRSVSYPSLSREAVCLCMRFALRLLQMQRLR